MSGACVEHRGIALVAVHPTYVSGSDESIHVHSPLCCPVVQVLQAQTKHGHISNSSSFTLVRISGIRVAPKNVDGMAAMCPPYWMTSQRLIRVSGGADG